MNIALWAPFLKKEISDFENFIVETIRHLIIQHQNDRFFIMTDTEHPVQLSSGGNTEIIFIKPPNQNKLFKKIWWDVKLPAILKKIEAHLFISFAGNCSLTAAIPQFIVINGTEKLRSSFIEKARAVFVTSAFIKMQLIKEHKASLEKIVVLYPAPGSYYSPEDAGKSEDIKAAYSESKEFFLFNSSFKKQEELVDLLKSFSYFKKRQQSSFRLLLLVELNPFFEKTLFAYKYRNDIKFIGTRDKDIRAAITAAAYAAVIPFNASEDLIAALNVMRSGVPLITTRFSSVNEVAGDAAVYAENDSKDIGDKMIQLYTDENFRSGLIGKGKERVKGFTHEKASEFLWHCIIKDL